MRSGPITWKPLSKHTVFSTRIFDIAEISSLSPTGTEHRFYTLDARDWVIVVPVLRQADNDAFFLMVTQWRHGSSAESIEFPGGVIDANEDPEQAALRELCEETGFTAKTMTHLASLSPNPAIMSNRCHIFLAEDMIDTQKPSPDDDEYLSVSTIPVNDVISRMGHGKYTHGLMLSSLFLYLQKKGASAPADTPS